MKYPKILATTLFLSTAITACSEPHSTENDTMTSSKNASAIAGADNNDPYIWLENVEGEDALNWVGGMNEKSLARLQGDARFTELRDRMLTIYNAPDKIAYASLQKGVVQNFWQDDKNVRGLWRRSDLASYASNETKWETVLDLDTLAEAEDENWVYKGRDCLAPDFERCIIELSRGGGDAVVAREFNTKTKSFVEGGFYSSEAKQWSAWENENTLLIATNFGEGTMNTSGYPRQVRRWARGTDLAEAELLIDGGPDIVFNRPFSSHRSDGQYSGIIQAPDFFTQIIYLFENGALKQLDLPQSIIMEGFFREQLIIRLRSNWSPADDTIKAGSLVAFSVADALGGTPENSLSVLFTPDASSSIDDVKIGMDRLFLNVLTDVTSTLKVTELSGGKWQTSDLDTPTGGNISIIASDDWSDKAFINYESFTQPDSLYVTNEQNGLSKITGLPERFDTSDMISEQKFATSKDGTKVPYFVIRHKDTPFNGNTPTMLYGYGGFEISLSPSYLTGFSQLWVQEGGAYVVANIRGGGEYGPAWHQAALNQNRQRAFDDFIAVAEKLVSDKLTSPDKLGIRGGSNGGLLMGAMFTQRPDLFKAVICAVPLLDMLRYHQLLAGASWMGEYGNPDIAEERAWIETYSPYQKVNAETKYPEIFFYTSTKDDRVHPGHARKMAHKMTDMGHQILYYEITEGGHAAAANLKQRALTDALQTVYALQKLVD